MSKKQINKNYKEQPKFDHKNDNKKNMYNKDNMLSEMKAELEKKEQEIIQNLSVMVKEQVEVNVTKRLREEEKKFNRGKNGKIIRRDIIIVILLAIIGYFGYCLYDVDYFNIKTISPSKVNKPNTTKDKSDKEPINNEQVTPEEPTEPVRDSAFLIDNYHNLIDNLQIDDTEIWSLYTNLTKDTISNDLKLKIAYKNLSNKDKNIKDEIISFDSSHLKDKIATIFGDDITIEDKTFSYNNIQFMYFNNSYIGYNKAGDKTNLVSKIIEAKEEDNKLIFKIAIGRLEDNNLLNNEGEIVIKNYKKDKITGNEEKINTYEFTFDLVNDNYLFSSIKELS